MEDIYKLKLDQFPKRGAGAGEKKKFSRPKQTAEV
jgi:hypothetical protein